MYKVAIWDVEETYIPAYHEADEYIDAYNCSASICNPETGEVICQKDFENLTKEEFENLKNGEIEIIPTKVGTLILV